MYTCAMNVNKHCIQNYIGSAKRS